MMKALVFSFISNFMMKVNCVSSLEASENVFFVKFSSHFFVIIISTAHKEILMKEKKYKIIKQLNNSTK